MQDWIFETGGDPMWTLPDQPMPTENDAANWFSPEPTDDFETWPPPAEAKGDPGDFGPMFIDGDGDGGADDDATELDEVVVTGDADRATADSSAD